MFLFYAGGSQQFGMSSPDEFMRELTKWWLPLPYGKWLFEADHIEFMISRESKGVLLIGVYDDSYHPGDPVRHTPRGYTVIWDHTPAQEAES